MPMFKKCLNKDLLFAHVIKQTCAILQQSSYNLKLVCDW